MSIYERFRPTPLAAIKERKNEVATITNQYEDSNEDRVKKMNIKDDGTYTIRMYPAHEIAGAIAVEPKVIYFLPAYVNKKGADGKWIKEGDKYVKTLGIKPVFDAKVHGKSDYDLVDTYISLTRKKADQLFPENEDKKKEYLLPLVGNKFSGGKYNGISPIRSFLFYGDLLIDGKSEFYEFEVKPSVQKQIMKTAAVEAGDDPLGTDGCFTDPIDGRPARIVVNSSAGRQDPSLWYSVSILNETVKGVINGRTVNVMKEYPISEEALEWFDKNVEPLIEYRTKFKHSDLKIQLEGLQLFDEEHGYGILEEEEFKEVYAYLDKKFPVPAEEENQDNDNSNSQSSSQDQLDLMDIKELKQYIKDNKLGITVLPRYSEDDLRELIREVESGSAGIDDQNDDENTLADDKGDEDSDSKEQIQTEDLQSRLAKIRARAIQSN